MNQTIEILVSPVGETQIITVGFSGAQCQEVTKFLEAALGQPTSEQLTSDFYQDVQQQERTQLES